MNPVADAGRVQGAAREGWLVVQSDRAGRKRNNCGDNIAAAATAGDDDDEVSA